MHNSRIVRYNSGIGGQSRNFYFAQTIPELSRFLHWAEHIFVFNQIQTKTDPRNKRVFVNHLNKSLNSKTAGQKCVEHVHCMWDYWVLVRRIIVIRFVMKIREHLLKSLCRILTFTCTSLLDYVFPLLSFAVPVSFVAVFHFAAVSRDRAPVLLLGSSCNYFVLFCKECSKPIIFCLCSSFNLK